jgi:hypothetical protein
MQKVAFRVVKSYFLLEGFALLQVAEDAAVATGHWFAMPTLSQARARHSLVGRRSDHIGNLRAFFFFFFFYIYFYIFACVPIFTRM